MKILKFILLLVLAGVATAAGVTVYDVPVSNQFDALMQSMPPNCTIRIAQGTNYSMGDTAWGPKTGQRIIGAGMGLTVLMFPSNAVVSGVLNRAHLIKPMDVESNISVSDLTLDCNYQPVLDVKSNLDTALKGSPNGAFTLDGISLTGSHNSVRRVQCINTAAKTSAPTNYAEAWGIMCVPLLGAFDAVGNDVEDCIVSDSHSNFNNDLVALGLMYGSGRVLNNTITQNGTNAMIGMMVGTHDVIAEGNIFNGVTLGSHYDSGQGVTNAIIANNDFNGCNTAIDWENACFQNVEIKNNIIGLTNTTGNATATVQAICPPPGTGYYTHEDIGGNRGSVLGAPYPNTRFVWAGNAKGLFIHDNALSAPLPNLLPNLFSFCSGTVSVNNYLFGAVHN